MTIDERLEVLLRSCQELLRSCQELHAIATEHTRRMKEQDGDDGQEEEL